MQQLNYFIFTGGPGAGKSTVLDEIKKRGYFTVREAARDIIRQQIATGGNALHTGDRVQYTQLMLQKSIEDYLDNHAKTETVFFDRGIPDLYSYTSRFCGGLDPKVEKAVTEYRYNPYVFIFPAWQEIYVHDSERKQDFNEAIETYDAVKQGYTTCGYTLIEVPKFSVKERADFILNEVRARS